MEQIKMTYLLKNPKNEHVDPYKGNRGELKWFDSVILNCI
jgi:hypothetical protein